MRDGAAGARAAITAAAPAVSVAPGARPRLQPGVARTLARWRAAHYSQVAYDLRIGIAEAADALDGALELRVTLSGAPVDLVLDWRPPAGGEASEIAINGVPLPRLRGVREHLVIAAARLRSGENVVRLRFREPIATAGTAVTRYEDREDGARYVYSLFVPADASTVFPCFDQPDLKARFTLELATPAAWEAVSNAPTARIDVAGPRKRTVFRATEPISTYLFAFAAGPFATIDETDGADGAHGGGGRTNTRLYVRAARKERALREAAPVLAVHRCGLDFLADWFACPLPFPKHDLVLVPEFPYGGMEHAGATFLREDAVLFAAAPSGTDRLRRAQLVFHETAHQWFGNLVTMRWFDDLWLKEGFANFMAAKATEALLPGTNAWTAFEELKASACRTDATRGTTPIRQPLANLAAAKSAYGSIVYGKGPALLRQAEFYLGADVFRRAAQALLRERAFGTADWRDLLRALERASGRDLGAWAQVWVTRRGMPTVRAAWHAARDGRIARFALVQRDARRRGGVWPMRVELALGRADGTIETVPVMLAARRTELSALVGRAAPRFVFANHRGYGYGRFPLDATSRAAVRAGVGAVADAGLRAALLDALWEEVRDARLAPAEYVAVALERLAAEPDEVVVASLLARTQRAVRAYLSEVDRAPVIGRVEHALAAGMHGAPTAGLRSQHFRAFAAVASSDEARAVLKRLLAGDERLPEAPLRARDRFAIVERLHVLGDASAAAALEAEARADRSDDARRWAFAAGAAHAEAATKARYFAAFLGDPVLPESWIEAALAPFNAVEHAALTVPYLGRALAALPRLKRERKIFFVDRWLEAFLGGQLGAAAGDEVERFLAGARLDRDLRLKVFAAGDELVRTVRIRAGRSSREGYPWPTRTMRG